MTTKIYVQTTPVNITAGIQRHLAIWIVKDGVTTIIDGKASGSLGAGIDAGDVFGELVLEKSIVNAVPDDGTVGDNEFGVFNLNELTFQSSQDAQDAADALINYYAAMGQQFLHDDRTFVRTGTGYLPNSTSNSVGNTLLSIIGIDFRDLAIYEDGNPSSQQYTPEDHAGHMGLIDGGGDDTLTANAYNGATTIIHDNAGDDIIVVENGGRVFITNDGNESGSNTILLEGIDPADIRLSRLGDTLIIFDNDTGLIVGWVDDHFVSDGPGVTDLVIDYNSQLTQRSLVGLDASDLDSYFSLLNRTAGLWFSSEVLPRTESAPLLASPLVLDLDGDGIELTSLTGSAVYWDIDQDGMAEAAGWVGPDDGLLAFDYNGDGIVTDHSELFGSQTMDGFLALSAVDSDGNGTINVLDDQFANLIVWRDINTDGISQSDELYSLSALSIKSIDLDYDAVSYGIAGNSILSESTFTLTNNTTRTIVDAWFAYDNANSAYTGDYNLDVRVLDLPTLRGYGEMADLHIAMSMDETLLDMVAEIASQGSLADLLDPAFGLEEKVRDVLFRWAGVESVVAGSRGVNVDAQELALLEALTDTPFRQHGVLPNPREHAGDRMGEAFDYTFNALLPRLVTQVSTGAIFNQAGSYDLDSDEFVGTYTLDLSALEDLVVELDHSGPDLLATWQTLVRIIDQTVGISSLSAPDLLVLEGIVEDSDLSSVLDLAYVISTVIPQEPNYLTGTSGNDHLIGGLGNDVIDGETGDDWLEGGSGHDLILGGVGNDTLDGAGGDDTVLGGDGDDAYIYALGLDTYRDTDGEDTIVFSSAYSSSQLTIKTDARIPSDLFIYIDDVLSIIIEDFHSASGSIETLSFSGEPDIVLDQIMSVQLGTSGNDTISGNDNPLFLNDSIHGMNGNDVIDGGLGDDLLVGGDGDDDYHVADGIDSINDEDGNDTVIFGAGLTSTTVSYLADMDGNLQISFGGALKAVIANHFTYEGQVETLQFSDSVTVNTSALAISQIGTQFDDIIYGHAYGALPHNEIYAGAGTDFVYGGAGNDVLYGEDGNDRLYGDDGNDELIGAAGSDILAGQSGNDTLNGGAGNDSLSGGVGDDLFTFAEGWGSDTLTEALNEGTDTIHFTGGLLAADLRILTDSEGELYIYDRANPLNVIKMNGDINNDGVHIPNVELILFDDASTIDMTGRLTLEGTDVADDIWGIRSRADTMYGYGGNDTLRGGVGDDYLYGGDGDDSLSGADNADKLYGEAGDDSLGGGAGNDELVGGTGNDSLNGGAGNDLYVFASGWGSDVLTEALNEGTDTIHFTGGLLVADLRFMTDSDGEFYIYSRMSPLNVIKMNGDRNSDGISPLNVEQLLFDDTSTLDMTGILTLEGTDAADDIWGIRYRADKMYGYGGNDTLHGGTGSDQLYGGEGSDSLSGADDADELYGEAGDDSLGGGAGNDLLIGGAGNDSVNGGTGNDIFSFASGWGSDTLTEALNQGTDTLHFTGGLLAADIRLTTGSDGKFYVYDRANSANVIVMNGYINSAGIDAPNVELILFDDASTIDLTMRLTLEGTDANDVIYGIRYRPDTMYGYGGDDSLIGHDGIDILYGGEGADSLSGANDADELYGEAGNDSLAGGAGNDKIDGGTGNDSLDGSTGNDLFVFASGWGNDTLTEASGQGTDTLHFTGGLLATDLRFTTDVNGEFYIYDRINSANVVTMNGSRNSTHGVSAPNVESIIFDDTSSINLGGNLTLEGTSANDAIYDLIDRSDILYGHDGDDYLYGYAGNDVLHGGDGADQIVGGTGSDTLNGDDGADYLYGGDGDDVLYGGDGYDVLSGDAGADTYRFSGPSAFTNYDRINGFNVGQGDKLDISDLLEGYDPLTMAITDFVEITTSGSDSVIKVDVDGGANNFLQIGLVAGVTGLTDEQALLTSGNIVA